MSILLRKSLLFSFLPIVVALSPVQAAEQANATLNVSATVLDSCTVTAPTSLVFASVSSSAATNDTSSGSIVVVCTAAHAAVTINAEGGDSASGGKRRMSGVAAASNKLPYDIFTTTGGSVAQISLRSSLSFCWTESSHALSLRRSKGREAVQDRRSDL